MWEQYERRTVGGVEPSVVEGLEHTLGCAVPGEYRRFLFEDGAGDVGGVEFYGLGTDFQGPPNLLWLLADLNGRGIARPAELLPIADVGNGSYVALVLKGADWPVGSLRYWDPMTGESAFAADDMDALLAEQAG